MSKNVKNKIDDIDNIVADMSNLCMNELYSDVVFLVEDQRLPGHRNILAARSEYFRAMLYGGMAESKEREIRLEVPLNAFKLILSYMYTGTLPLSTLDVDTIIDVLAVAHLYVLLTLVSAITKHIANILAVPNVCIILEAARRCSLDELTHDCYNFMDRNVAELLEHRTFTLLSKESLEEFLRYHKSIVPEVDIFRSVCKWKDSNPNVDMTTIVSQIRLPLMSIYDLLHSVRDSGIVSAEEILSAMIQMMHVKNLTYRSVLLPRVDVASEEYLARWTNSNSELFIQLNKYYIINFIGNFQCDMEHGKNGFEVKVSDDNVQWDWVGTRHGKDLEDIHFRDRSVRYIRVGTINSFDFDLFKLSAMHKSDCLSVLPRNERRPPFSQTAPAKPKE